MWLLEISRVTSQVWFRRIYICISSHDHEIGWYEFLTWPTFATDAPQMVHTTIIHSIITVGELRSAIMYDPKCSTKFPWCTINAQAALPWCTINAQAALPRCTINAPAVFAWCTNQFVHKVEFIEWNGVHTLWLWFCMNGEVWHEIRKSSICVTDYLSSLGEWSSDTPSLGLLQWV